MPHQQQGLREVPQMKLPLLTGHGDDPAPQNRKLQSLLRPRTVGVHFFHRARHIFSPVDRRIGQNHQGNVAHVPRQETGARGRRTRYLLGSLNVDFSVAFLQAGVQFFDFSSG